MLHNNSRHNSQKNAAQGLLLTALLLLVPIAGRADQFDDQKNHLQELIDQANTVRDNLGPGLVNALSKGAAQFVLLGDKVLSPAWRGAPRARKASPGVAAIR